MRFKGYTVETKYEPLRKNPLWGGYWFGRIIFGGFCEPKFYGSLWEELGYDKLPLRRGRGQVAVRRKIVKIEEL